MPTFLNKHLRLSQLRPLAPAAVQSLAAAWDVRMVYESNSIEGNTLTLRETEVVLSKGLASGKQLTDHLAAVALAKAWTYLKNMAAVERELKGSHLQEVYKILSGKGQTRWAHAAAHSSLRGFAAAVGGSSFEEDHDGDLLLGLPSDAIEKAARLHNRIIRDSRFESQSGLIARLAMNFVLLASGYPPVSISPELRTTYYAALEAADSGDFSAWLAFITTRLNEEFDWWLEALSETSETP